MSDFGRQVEEHVPRLRRYARALTGDRHKADDLVQDALERAWNKFHLWRPGSDLRAWLFTIMHNVFVNQLRQGTLADLGVPLEQEALEVAGSAGQEQALVLRDLDAALQRLPSEQREVLLLVGLENLRYEEAARVLGVPIGTVMSRLSRGREQLRRLMAGEAAGATLTVVK
ncbi:MAG TPA: RNA polymerase sigma factor [Burkholderiales bacterium]|nr:RNA polymerase sigma factor [Burkholderiales bacterium]